MSDNKYVKAVSDELNMKFSVFPRHLPHYTRFTSSLKVEGGVPIRTFSPPTLSSLASALVVANTDPEDVQR